MADILSRATIKETKLFLPSERLAPPLYKAVNAVLERAGGQWSKRDKAHVFTDDPRSRLGIALETGVAKFDAATAAPKLRDAHAKKERQAFYTPSELARQIVEMADVDGKAGSTANASGGTGAATALLAARTRATSSSRSAGRPAKRATAPSGKSFHASKLTGRHRPERL